MLQDATKDQVYDTLYGEAIRRVDGLRDERGKSARKALSWITYAERTLTVGELCHALAVDLDNKDLNEDNISDVKDIVSFCAGLVIIDEASNVVRLVHYTTQEYFQRARTNWIPNAQEEIALVCITYISFHPFRTGPCDTVGDFTRRENKYQLFNYASSYWGHHAQTVEATIFEATLPFLLDNNLVSCTVQSRYNLLRKANATGLHLTAGFGLLYLSERLSYQTIDFNSMDGEGRTPLSWAAKNGHKAVVKLLLAEGADIEAKNYYNQTPLSLVAEDDHEAVVELLLAKGADPIDFH